MDFEKLGPLAMYARVDFLETYYVMGWFPVNTVETLIMHKVIMQNSHNAKLLALTELVLI